MKDGYDTKKPRDNTVLHISGPGRMPERHVYSQVIGERGRCGMFQLPDKTLRASERKEEQ